MVKDGAVPWVLHDLQTLFFMAGCKALGLVCKIITSPLWNLIANKSINIMDMNLHYLQLVTFLKDANNNLHAIMPGEIQPFPNVPLMKDILYKTLIEESEVDEDCMVILSATLTGLAKLAQKLYADHLPNEI